MRTFRFSLSPIFFTLLLLVGGCSEDTSVVNTFPDADHPRVVSVISVNNTTVMVTFSQTMAGGQSSTENPANYQIVQADGGGAVVLVYSAVLDESTSTSVELTTSSQSAVAYEITVSKVTDTQGRPIASGVDPDNPSSTMFVGTAPNGADLVDSDNDGLADSSELLGWTVTILLGNGEGSSRHVTSDPFSSDTDGDGVMDMAEKSFGTDPRSADTDADELSDFQELHEIYSSPVRQDTDADELFDGREFNEFKTSASLADTDGDQISDFDEILLGNRNPRLSDLPLPGIEIGDMDLRLDVRFRAQSTTGSRELETKQVTSTLSQNESRLFSNTDSKTNEVFAKFSIERNLGGTTIYEDKNKLDFGYTHGWSSSVKRESSEETQAAYEDSLTTQAETTQEETISREVVGATMKVTVNVRSVGDIAFTISNLQISVLMQDPRSPDQLLPIAVLVPDPASGTPNQFSLGPLVPFRGPFIFNNDQIFPSLVEDLMRDPRGLMFKVANFDITDEFGRNFAYTSQGINDRTGALVIDYGGADLDGDGEGETTERLRVSTAAGRAIADTNGDGLVDDQDQRVLFDADGRQVGITVREALESILGLSHYDNDVTPSSTLSDEERSNSYATRMIAVDTDGDDLADKIVETLWRVREVSMDDNPLKQWEILTPTGIDRRIDLGTRLIDTSEGLVFAFVQDLDDDGIPARWEYLYGCSDTQSDTDGDGLDDRFEAFEGWEVSVVGKRTIKSYSSCARLDSDRDGIADDAEANRVVDLDTNGDGVPDVFAVPAPTDAKRLDTDDDKIDDFNEINGFSVELKFDRDAAKSGCTVPSPDAPRLILCSTDPLNPDSDGDTLGDGDEMTLGTDPTVDDGDKFFDNDEDGLVNFFEEQIGWQVTYYMKSVSCAEQGDPDNCTEPVAVQGEQVSYTVTSDPDRADADFDGLTDRQERDLGTDPDKLDTDEDGLSDGDEIAITYLSDGTEEYTLKTDPLDADIDNDLRSDGDEVLVPWIVYVEESAPEQVYSDPLVADADFDRLFDYAEFQLGTHPHKFDTDSDGYSDDREIAADRNTDPLTPDQLIEFKYTTIKIESDCDGGSGEFYGKWLFELNGDQDVVYDANADWDTGRTATINRARDYILNARDTFYARIIDVYEQDDGDNDVLDDEFLLFRYPVATGNDTITSTGTSDDAFVSDCKLVTTITYTEK